MDATMDLSEPKVKIKESTPQINIKEDYLARSSRHKERSPDRKTQENKTQ